MDKFLTLDFDITSVKVAMFVNKFGSKQRHINRPSHGLALYANDLPDDKKIYTFDDGRSLLVGQNELIYIPQHSSYTVSSTIPGGCYAINFTLAQEVNIPPFIFKPKNLSAIVNYFKSTVKTWQAKKTAYHMECKANLYKIIALLQNEYHMQYISPKNKDAILPAIELIHKRYQSESLSISELAKSCGISENYFRIIFKNIYGTSPQKYINSLKIAHFKELLASGLCSISEAAEMSGYTDLCYFSRAFKKAEGMTPSEFSKKL